MVLNPREGKVFYNYMPFLPKGMSQISPGRGGLRIERWNFLRIPFTSG